MISPSQIQPTDLYPDLFKALSKILLSETLQFWISTLPYFPIAYTSTVGKKTHRPSILAAFEKGILCTITTYASTDYYQILKVEEIPVPRRWIFLLKFYRFFKAVRKMGFNLDAAIKESQNRIPGNHIGNIVYWDIKKILPPHEFDAYDRDILNLFDKGLFKTIFEFMHTSYYQIQRKKRKKNLPQTLKWILKYYKIYRSIKKHGFQLKNNSLKSYPCVFDSPGLIMRLDGHHRAAVANHFGLEKLPILLITPEDLLNYEAFDRKLLADLPGKVGGESRPFEKSRNFVNAPPPS